MEIVIKRDGTLFKRLSQKIDSSDNQRKSLRNSLASSALALETVLLCFVHCVPRLPCERITFSCVWVERETLHREKNLRKKLPFSDAAFAASQMEAAIYFFFFLLALGSEPSCVCTPPLSCAMLSSAAFAWGA